MSIKTYKLTPKMLSKFTTLTSNKIFSRLSDGFGVIGDPEYIPFLKSIDTKFITSTIKNGILEGAKMNESKEDILFIISEDDTDELLAQLNRALETLAKIEKEVIYSYLQPFYNDKDFMEYANKKLPNSINITVSTDRLFDTKDIDDIIKWIDCALVVSNVLSGMDGYNVMKFIRKYIYTSIKGHDLQTLANSKIPEYMYDITTRTMVSLSGELKDYIDDVLREGIRDGYETNVIDPKKVHKCQRLYNEFQQVAYK